MYVVLRDIGLELVYIDNDRTHCRLLLVLLQACLRVELSSKVIITINLTQSMYSLDQALASETRKATRPLHCFSPYSKNRSVE